MLHWLQMGVFYLMSKRVLRSIPYGPNPRNRLDMYIPRNHWKNPDMCIPVVIYTTGAHSMTAAHCTPVFCLWLHANLSHGQGCAPTWADVSLWTVVHVALACRWCLDDWIQGLGLAAGQATQQERRHRLLPGLPQLSAGLQPWQASFPADPVRFLTAWHGW